MKINIFRGVFSMLTLLIQSYVAAQAQAVAVENAASIRVKKEDAVQLSEFLVSEKGDSGYLAKNALAGTRSNERLVNIPQNIQIITRDLIRDLAQDNPTEAIKYGSSGVNKRANLVSDAFLRGFRTNVFLKDNIPNGGGAGVNAALYDIDRIEVVKGPAALLYGQTASVGGLINFISKRPTKTPQSSVKATIGSFNLYRGEANTSGPLGDVGLNYRVTVAKSAADGARKFDYSDDQFFSSALDYNISPTASVSFDYTYYLHDESISNLSLDTTSQLIKVSDDFTFFEPWVEFPQYNHFANLTFRQAITSSLQVQLVLNFLKNDIDRQEIRTTATNSVTGIMNRVYLNEKYDQKDVNLLIDVVKSFSKGRLSHKLSFGGIIHGNRRNAYVDWVNIAPLNIYNPVYNTPLPQYTRSVPTPGSPGPNANSIDTRQESGYIQEQVSFLEGKAIIVGGLRFNQYQTTNRNRLVNTVSQLRDQTVVKRVGAIYKPAGALSLYYNYSESFIFNSGLFVGGPRNGDLLDPSTAKNNELGVKVETANGRIFGSAAAFDLDLTNVRVIYVQPNGQQGVGQFGAETNKGFEFDVGLSVETPAGPLQSILTYYKGDSKNAAGIQPNGVTNDIWSVYMIQSAGTGPLKGWRVGVGAYFRDETPFSTPAGQPLYRLPGYTTTTGIISYDRSNVRVSLNIDNIFDKFFIEGGQQASSMDPNPGRNVKFSLEYRF
ncbi:MAG: TonB-dependent siderophore receptor [Verrucomicrobia bacterium]|nr:TonB-dependent siderophore receptor [Verrucomicrobiota bacterium]